ncbi:olfactory receptor 14K1-like [Tachyglossus aculeatus]|uniref:olfactory receptor 14K1-like n=1 Tax=Tachyglossus aculeatus TaxID=9261 RepID=UPI0018F27B8A|nr:olfactory receptor 14K1-like [Tachyglossus aculeatus]
MEGYKFSDGFLAKTRSSKNKDYGDAAPFLPGEDPGLKQADRSSQRTVLPLWESLPWFKSELFSGPPPQRARIDGPKTNRSARKRRKQRLPEDSKLQQYCLQGDAQVLSVDFGPMLEDMAIRLVVTGFLLNLAFMDTSYVSVTIPKSILNSLLNVNSISLPACTAQFFLMIFLVVMELALMTIMSHDHFVAICHHLFYNNLMHRRACASLLAAFWLSCGPNATLYMASVFSLSFSKTIGLSFFCFVLIVAPYSHIFWTKLRMLATEGQIKAFSTCLPHLAVVTLFITSGSSAYPKSIYDSPSALELMLFISYSVVPHSLNLLIYSLKNRDMKFAMEKHLGKKSPQGPFL